MQLSGKEARIVQKAIITWEEKGLLSPELSQTLQNSYETTRFDWRRVARYSFWLAIGCILVSLSTVLADQWLLALLGAIFTAPDLVLLILLGSIAAGLYHLGIRRKRAHPHNIYSSEALFFLGVAVTAIALAYLGKVIDIPPERFSLLLLSASILYGILGLWFPSRLVWVFALLSLGSWFGAETGYVSGWGAYYLGMNFPSRFVLFGLILLMASALVFREWSARVDFLAPSRAIALLYLFIALWILSIFGNYGDLEAWHRASRTELFHWSLLFAAAAIASIWHGVRYDDGMTRGFGLTFLFINLYTRFFEFFWEGTHKAIFFALLALSFAYLGSRAERIWHLSSGASTARPMKQDAARK